MCDFECFQFVAEPENNHLKFLETGLIIVDDATMKVIENPTVVLEETQEALIELSEIDEEEYIDKSEVPIEAEIEEIKEVAGIKDALFEKMKAFITVEE